MKFQYLVINFGTPRAQHYYCCVGTVTEKVIYPTRYCRRALEQLNKVITLCRRCGIH